MSTCLKSGRRLTLFVILAIALAVAGCTGYQQPPGPPATPQTTTAVGNTVTMKNFAFSPQSLTVSPGSTVAWVNQDSAEHQIVSDSLGSNAEGTLFKSGMLPAGATYSFRFDNAGTYPYHCSIHPSMKGTIIVQ